MVVIIKLGRRVYRKFQRLRQPHLIQAMLWKNIEYGILLSTKKMKEFEKSNPEIFSHTYRKFKEEDETSLNYNIQWIEIIINSTPKIEEEEYVASMKLFSELENSKIFKNKNKTIEVDEELAKEYKNLNKGKIKKAVEAGYKKVKGITLNKSLNDVGIITIVEKYSEDEVKE